MPSFSERFPWPMYASDEVSAATEALTSGKVNYWTGKVGRTFEEAFARYTGSRHAIAISNGTATLEVAALALGLQPGDEFVTTPRTFVGTVSALALRGLNPVFADVDRDSGNITADSIEAVWTPRTRMILPVHLGGWPCDMPAIIVLARRKGASVIEDCAQAHRAKIGGRSIGTFGEIGSWSFCQDKIITTAGEGGMITVNDEELWSKMWSLKDHGKSYEAVYHREHAPGFRWLHEGWGGNYRMAEFQSAVGLTQLTKLDEWVTIRNRNAKILFDAIGNEPTVRVPIPAAGIEHAYYRAYVYVEASALADGWSRDRILAEIQGMGIPSFVGSCSEIYLEKAFANAGIEVRRLPVAHELTGSSMAFLTHPTITESGMAEVAEAVKSVLCRAKR